MKKAKRIIMIITVALLLLSPFAFSVAAEDGPVANKLNAGVYNFNQIINYSVEYVEFDFYFTFTSSSGEDIHCNKLIFGHEDGADYIQFRSIDGDIHYVYHSLGDFPWTCIPRINVWFKISNADLENFIESNATLSKRTKEYIWGNRDPHEEYIVTPGYNFIEPGEYTLAPCPQPYIGDNRDLYVVGDISQNMNFRINGDSTVFDKFSYTIAAGYPDYTSTLSYYSYLNRHIVGSGSYFYGNRTEGGFNYYNSDSRVIVIEESQMVSADFYDWFMSNVVEEELEYQFDDEINGYWVTGIGNVTDNDIHIPYYFDGPEGYLRVWGVWREAFYGNSQIEEVYFADSSEGYYIYELAFQYCSNLKYVRSSDVITVRSNAFMGCSSLSDFDFSRVKYLMSNSFVNTALTSVSFSNSLVNISAGAFNSCSYLSEISIPLSVNTIELGAFNNCTSLKKVNYAGDIRQKESISIGDANTSLLNASWSYAYVLYDFYKHNGDLISELSFRAPSDYTVTLRFGSKPFYVFVAGDSYIYTGDDIFVGFSKYANGEVTYYDSDYVIEGSTAARNNFYLYDENLDFIYSEEDDGYYVSGIGRCTKNDIEIPDTYNGRRVLGIYRYAFSNLTHIYTVDLGDYCSYIGNYAFQGCTNLKRINFENMIPGSYIGNYSFENCTNLTSGDLSRIDSIGYAAFRYCTSLSDLTFSISLTKLDQYSFSNSGVKNVDIPYSLKVVSGGAFEACKNLTTVHIPLIDKIDLWAFGNCDNITQVSFDGDYLQAAEIVVTRGNENFLKKNWIYQYVYYYFYDYKGDVISDMTFRAHSSDEVQINFDKVPLTVVTHVGTYTYNVDFPIKGFSSAAQGDVTYVSGKHVISGSNKAHEDIYFYADILDFVWSDQYKGYLVSGIGYVTAKGVLIPETYRGEPVVGVADRAFVNNTNITSVTIPSDFKIIGDSSFRGCKNLATLNFELMFDGKISDDAFYDCSSLAEINLINVKTIGNRAFYNNTSLSSVAFSDTLSSIGEYGFYGCSALKVIDLPDSLSIISGYTFANSGLESLKFGNVTNVQAYAFNGTNLQSVFYRGDYKQAERIIIGKSNEPFEEASWSYEYVFYNFYDYKGRKFDGLCFRTRSDTVVSLHFEEDPFRVSLSNGIVYNHDEKFIGFSDRKLGDVFDTTTVYLIEGLTDPYMDIYLANTTYRGDIILDEFDNSSNDFIDKSDKLQSDLGSLHKPDVGDVSASLDNVVNEEVITNVESSVAPLSSIFEAPIVLSMILIGLTMALSSYILFGKKR